MKFAHLYTAKFLDGLASDCERRMVDLAESSFGTITPTKAERLARAANYATVSETLRRMERESVK